MGTPQIGADVLEGLLNSGIEISAVLTQPDKPQGRSKELVASPVKVLGTMNNICAHQPNSKDELTNLVKEIQPDLAIVAAFGMIIPKEALLVPRYGMINFHPSLLPLYRGPSPITAPIINGDTKTGVSIIQMDEKMDKGDILDQKEVAMNLDETYETLSAKLAKIGVEMLTELIPRIFNAKVTPTTQTDSKASYTKMIKKEDGIINWDKDTAQEIERKSRAYHPWPGIYCFWNNKKIGLFDITVIDTKVPAGEVLIKENQLLIGTQNGAISPGQIQLEGKNKVPTPEFIKGHQSISGQKLN